MGCWVENWHPGIKPTGDSICNNPHQQFLTPYLHQLVSVVLHKRLPVLAAAPRGESRRMVGKDTANMQEWGAFVAVKHRKF